MEFFILLLTLAVLAETSVLLIRSQGSRGINKSERRKVYVDTSAVMDARLLPVAKTGFIGDDLLIPRSVTNELQLLADGKDSEKRVRARAGLETIRELERVVYFNASIWDDALDRTPVDNRLIELAKANRGMILTNDYNLQKVAETEHIDVLNLNELALALRSQYVPGEKARLKITATGSNPNQGVGYLSDGTMVVVDNAANKVGNEVEIEFLRVNQTASGTLMFAKLTGNNGSIVNASVAACEEAPNRRRGGKLAGYNRGNKSFRRRRSR